MPDLIGENNDPTAAPDVSPDTNAGEAPRAAADQTGADTSLTVPADTGTSAPPLDPSAQLAAIMGEAQAPAQVDAVPPTTADVVDPAHVAAVANASFNYLQPADYSDHKDPVVGTAEAPEPADTLLLMQSGDTVAASDTIDPVGTYAPRLAQLGENDAPPPSIDPLVDFIIGQLSPVEALGFLRGAIIWLAGRLGTPAAQPLDATRLDAFNLAFQYRLREMKVKNDAALLNAQDKETVFKAQAEADAKARGFDSVEQMQVELQGLYNSVEERLKQWYQSTEPGGDVTAAPDTDALLYDAYRITQGVARSKA